MRRLPAISFVLALGACGASAAFADDGDVTVRPPAGWTAQSYAGHAGYLAPDAIGGFHPNIVVNYEDAPIDDEVAALKGELQHAGFRYVSDADIPCKSGYRGRLVEFTHTQLGFDIDVLQVQMGRKDGHRTAFITYSRPVGSPANPRAVASMKSPCSP